MAPGSTVVRIEAVPGHGDVRSPVSGRSGLFASVELWAGDEPGGVLRRLGGLVLGDVVRLVAEADGVSSTVVVRHLRLEGSRATPRSPLPRELPAELVPLLSRAPRSAAGLALVERVFAAGHRFAWERGEATLRDLDEDRHGG